ncbi:MAG: helix-turn-helix transcriptional regulator [Armatimonadota bacterium]|nr:helix-turn-helix transcriptional regulator [Armatimonadota bacterium]
MFRQTYGVAPMQMLRDLRLQRARHLLESTDRTVASIAELCGFEDAAYFTRVFRRRMGLSPGRHRQSVRTARRSYSPAEEA